MVKRPRVGVVVDVILPRREITFTCEPNRERSFSEHVAGVFARASRGPPCENCVGIRGVARQLSSQMGKAALETRISDSHYINDSEIERSSKKMMRALVPATAPLRILDIGCGTGLNASYLRAAGHSVVGVDLSAVAIEKLRLRGFEGWVCDIESQQLPMAAESFDLVYASEVIEHCADTEAFLHEVFRVLKPGGKLLLSTPNSAFWPFRILGLIGRTATEYQHPGHVRFFSKRSLRRAIESAGFDSTKISARHLYLILGSVIDPLGRILRVCGLEKEGRFRTGGHFWQLSKFASRASTFWADTFVVSARKPDTTVGGSQKA